MNTPSEESGPRALSWVDYADSIRRGIWPPNESDRRVTARPYCDSPTAPKEKRPSGAAAPDSVTRS